MSACVGYDITIPKEKYETAEMLMHMLFKWCKKWVFQIEKGEKTGYVHYQCRVHLMKKQTLQGVLADIAPVVGGNWSITSKSVHDGNKFNYVMKMQTFVEGPWTEDDYEIPKPMTWQLAEFLKWDLLPWQVQIIDICEQRSMRDIHIIYDHVGHAGKSIFAEYLEYKHLAFEMMAMRCMEDLLQFAHSFKPAKCYLIDMPRGMKKDKLAEFYSGIEVLKNGVTYDKRYAGKKRRMGRPQIIVFTNALPVFELMSPDRWVVLEMINRSLIPWQGPSEGLKSPAPAEPAVTIGGFYKAAPESPESADLW